jgi:hypothetical protein
MAIHVLIEEDKIQKIILQEESVIQKPFLMFYSFSFNLPPSD